MRSLLRLKVPGSKTTLIFSLSFLSNFYVVSIVTAIQRKLLLKILICDYIICDRPFSHMGQEYPFLWLSETFLSWPAFSSWDK